MAQALEASCRQLLDRYEVPKRFIPTPHIPLTETNKPARAEAKKLALQLFNAMP